MIIPEEPTEYQAGEIGWKCHRIPLRTHIIIKCAINGAALLFRPAASDAILVVVPPTSNVSIVLSMIQKDAVIPFPVSHGIV